MLPDVIGFIPFALDIGHGIDNPKAYGGLSEFDWNQRLAEKVIPLALHNGFMPVIGQWFNQKTTSLTRRYRIYDPCICGFSIHVDAHGNLNVNGLSVYHWITSSKGLRLAELYAETFKEVDCPIRFMKLDEADTDPGDGTYDNMGILRETTPPFILIEHGYKTNDSDRAYLQTQESIDMFAVVLIKTLCKFAGKEYTVMNNCLEGPRNEIQDLSDEIISANRRAEQAEEKLELVKNAVSILKTV